MKNVLLILFNIFNLLKENTIKIKTVLCYDKKKVIGFYCIKRFVFTEL